MLMDTELPESQHFDLEDLLYCFGLSIELEIPITSIERKKKKKRSFKLSIKMYDISQVCFTKVK